MCCGVQGTCVVWVVSSILPLSPPLSLCFYSSPGVPALCGIGHIVSVWGRVLTAYCSPSSTSMADLVLLTLWPLSTPNSRWSMELFVCTSSSPALHLVLTLAAVLPQSSGVFYLLDDVTASYPFEALGSPWTPLCAHGLWWSSEAHQKLSLQADRH